MQVCQLKMSKEDRVLLIEVCDDFDRFNAVNNTYKGIIKFLWEEIVRSTPLSIDKQIMQAVRQGVKLILISNLPVPLALEPSPCETKWRTGCAFLPTDFMHYKVAYLLGTKPKTYKEEHNGNHIHNITPVKSHEGEFSSAGDSEFPYHVEVPQDENNPSWFSLACLRGDTEVFTSVIDSDRMMGALDAGERAAIRYNIMRLSVNPSYTNAGEVLEVPLVRNKNFFIFASVEMRPIPENPYSQSVYDKCMKVITEEPDVSHSFSAGDFAIINNRQVVHSRGVSGLVNTDRWLTRMYYE